LTANVHRPARHFARRLGGDIETMLPPKVRRAGKGKRLVIENGAEAEV
jgi:hypothetical protein